MRSHLLQVLDNNQVCIHEAINTVLHAGLLASVQFARRNLAGDAFAETGVGEGVDGCGTLVSIRRDTHSIDAQRKQGEQRRDR